VTGVYEGNAFGVCSHAVMNVPDMTWVHMLLGGVKLAREVRAMGLLREQVAGAGKHVNIAISARLDTTCGLKGI